MEMNFFFFFRSTSISAGLITIIWAFSVILLNHVHHADGVNSKRHNHGKHQVEHSSNFLDVLLPNKQGIYTADFDQTNGTVIRVRDGEDVTLDCNVYLRHNKTVSWMRHSGNTLELLTVGDVTYSGDTRFNISYKYPNNWRLNLTNVGKDDAGVYLCQLSTFPPKVLVTHLMIEDALVEVVDSSGQSSEVQYYKPGSEIELGCIVRGEDGWRTEVTWLKDGDPLQINLRPTISIGTKVDATHVLSRLWIGGAKSSDSGNYTCSIVNNNKNNTFPRASIRVHVVDGEFHAAVHGSSPSSRSCLYIFTWITSIIRIINN